MLMYPFNVVRHNRPEVADKSLPNAALANFCQLRYSSDMNTMNVSLPAPLKSFVDEQVEGRGYGTCSAYIRELIRHDRDRQHLRGLLLVGGESAPAVMADTSYFETLRAGVRRQSKG